LALFGDSKQALDILLPIFASDPRSPGAAHYIIHATDSADLAQIGLPAARKYASIAPDSPHALHMPSHIFCRLGLWQEAIRSNEDSARVAHQWVLEGRRGGVFDEEHARNTMIYAYLQSGQTAAARRQINLVAAVESLPIAHGDGWMKVDNQMRYDLELRDWKDAAQIDPPSGAHFEDNFETYWIHTMAESQLGKITLARDSYSKFLKSAEMFPHKDEYAVATGIKLETIQGEAILLHAEHHDAESVAKLQEGAAFEKKSFVYYPDSLPRPSEELLGDLLMTLHRVCEAKTAYQRALLVTPNRFNSVFGAFRSSVALHDSSEAERFASLLIEIAPMSADRQEVVVVRRWLNENSTKGNAANAKAPIARTAGHEKNKRERVPAENGQSF
jgi:tetratricopeptide (TPR) repeat protein